MFKIIYAAGMFTMFLIRIYFRWRFRNNKIVESRKTTLEIFLLSVAFIGMFLIPLSFVFSSLFDFVNYILPSWSGWIGTIIFLLALWLLWRSQSDLGRNWFQTLELREGHQLITNGVYKKIRHPMYAAFWLWGIAQPLLLHNWIAGWSHLAVFGLLYFLRVPREEEMMIDKFGEEYKSYMKRTGRVIPHFIKKDN